VTKEATTGFCQKCSSSLYGKKMWHESVAFSRKKGRNGYLSKNRKKKMVELLDEFFTKPFLKKGKAA
jgi:hypothetical protein